MKTLTEVYTWAPGYRYRQYFRRIVRVLFGAAIATGASAIVLGAGYAVSHNPGTTFQAGPARVQWEPPIDNGAILDNLGAVPNTGAFGSAYAARASRHNYVIMTGHQPYTLPQDPYDL